ncbi:hypothetical protein J4450_01280 [Candidatus Micrarchaeota archaeon]|nr:hypothetical protein [Candidatus Micrarchaeota archaeon]
MTIKLGLMKVFISLINTIGSILVLLGFFIFLNAEETTLLIIGLFLIIITEAASINMLNYEEKRKLENTKDEFLKNIGMIFAWPVLLFILYMMSPNKAVLSFTFIMTITAAIKAISLIIKVYLIDKRIVIGRQE